MGTVVSVQLVDTRTSAAERARTACDWFLTVERCCSRFDADSELSRLSRTVGRDVPVSPLLFELLHAACAVADASEGAFDPTMGQRMRARSHDRHFRTQQRQPETASVAATPDTRATWRDIHLDRSSHIVRLTRALELDLGAIAKGFAVDLAARDLADCEHVCINAGGDLFARGQNAAGARWSAGIRDPHDATGLIARVELDGVALCTSGNYERLADGASAHLLDPRAADDATGVALPALASVSVAAPTTMMADAFATAAFVLGVDHGRAFLEAHGADGLFVTASGNVLHTQPSYFVHWTPLDQERHAAR
jgi:thiamine biosynthesis lipoprotein